MILEELKCDSCGSHLGWISPCDDQNEYFCDACAKREQGRASTRYVEAENGE